MSDEMLASHPRLHVGEIIVEPGIRAPRQVGPHAAVAVGAVGGVEVACVALGVERLDPAETALHRRAWRPLARAPAFDGKSDRLPKPVGMAGHLTGP